MKIADCSMHVREGGSGPPLLVLHHDIGTPDSLPLYDELAARHTVYVPDHPGWGRSERPDWARGVRDLAVMYQWLVAELGLQSPTLVGLGFGGWIAAEMATMSPTAYARLVLVGAAGIQPEQGEILDQALVNYIAYVQAGFHDQAAFRRVFGAEPPTDTLEQWDIHREMCFRVAWRPYMYSQTLPRLLGGVQSKALIVWGDDDRVIPLECGKRYAAALPNARLEIVPGCGHFVDLERPSELAALVLGA
ncbi:MAG: alpha/beta hydrolase [Chloroflexota bacterium]